MNGKQLKNSILQWAIQGKLVPQDPNDEPASVLLERIRAERARLVKEGKIKKDKNESIIYRGEDNSHYEKFADGTVRCIDDEIPFEIPAGWEWARLGSIVSNSTGLSYQKELLEEKADSMIRVLRGGNIEDGSWQKKDDDVLIAAKYVKPDLLLRQGTFITPAVTSLEQMGKTGLIKSDEESTVVGGFVLMLIPFVSDESLISYLHIVFQTGYYKNYCKQITKKSGQAFYNLSRPLLMACLIPIPSHKNLRSIVAECETIRPYIEKYGEQQDELDSLNQSLKTKLRKSVLQEAIQGRLIPQDPTDEPASVLLDFIQTEKEKLLKEGKLKKKDIVESYIFKGEDNKYYERVGSEVSEVELPLQFPESWIIVRLQTICALTDGERRIGDAMCMDAKYLRGKSTGDHIESGKYVHAGDNIILVDGENSGEVFTVPIDGYMGSTFKQLWVSKNLHLPYVLACIRFYKDELRNSKKGAAIPHLNKDIFRNLVIGIPPEREQERIMAKLDEIDRQL